MNINEYVFKAINGFAHKSAFLDSIMIVFSKYVPIIFMAALGIAYFVGLFNRDEKLRGISIDTLAITVINLALSYVIGIFYYVPRPFVNSKVNLLFPHIIDASFPSDHAVGTMSIAVGMNRYNKLYGRVFVLLSILVGISRVYVGHHFPSDVVGGYAIVLLVNLIYRYLVKDRVQNLYFKLEAALAKYLPILDKYVS